MKPLASHTGTYGTTLVMGNSIFKESVGNAPNYQQAITYVPNDGSRPTEETLWSAGPADLSAAQPNSEYDSKCALCYYGYGHTQERHQSSMSYSGKRNLGTG